MDEMPQGVTVFHDKNQGNRLMFPMFRAYPMERELRRLPNSNKLHRTYG